MIEDDDICEQQQLEGRFNVVHLKSKEPSIVYSEILPSPVNRTRDKHQQSVSYRNLQDSQNNSTNGIARVSSSGRKLPFPKSQNLQAVTSAIQKTVPTHDKSNTIGPMIIPGTEQREVTMVDRIDSVLQDKYQESQLKLENSVPQPRIQVKEGGLFSTERLEKILSTCESNIPSSSSKTVSPHKIKQPDHRKNGSVMSNIVRVSESSGYCNRVDWKGDLLRTTLSEKEKLKVPSSSSPEKEQSKSDSQDLEMVKQKKLESEKRLHSLRHTTFSQITNCPKCGGSDLFRFYHVSEERYYVRCYNVPSYVYKELDYMCGGKEYKPSSRINSTTTDLVSTKEGGSNGKNSSVSLPLSHTVRTIEEYVSLIQKDLCDWSISF